MRKNLTLKERLTALEERIQRERDIFEKVEPIIRDVLDNKLFKNHLTSAYLSWDYNRVWGSISDYDLPTIIDHVCGPIHRKHQVDWKLSVPYGDTLKLETVVKGIEINLYIYENDMKSCFVERVAIRDKTEEERKQDILQATETKIYENLINCTGEDNGS